jgi:tRNA threonylcarbamoyladenosine biosynthesis protein TsaE
MHASNSNPVLTFENLSSSDLPLAASRLLEEFLDHTIFCLYGDMGAGKTTFIAALVAAAGSIDYVQSPTFGLVHEYKTTAGERLLHFDLYRLKSIDEAFESGVFELLDSGDRCFVEWPERINTALPERFVAIKISRVENLCSIVAEQKTE